MFPQRKQTPNRLKPHRVRAFVDKSSHLFCQLTVQWQMIDHENIICPGHVVRPLYRPMSITSSYTHFTRYCTGG